MIEFYQHWENVNTLPVEHDFTIQEILPDKQRLQTVYYLCRNEVRDIPCDQWPSIQDPERGTSGAIPAWIERYFSVCIYELRNVKSLSICAGESLITEATVTNRASNRLIAERNHFYENRMQYTALDTDVEDTATEEQADLKAKSREEKDGYTTRNPLEHNAEKNQFQREMTTYTSMNYDRTLIWWSLFRVYAIYRVDLGNATPKLVFISDHYLDTFKKTYRWE